MARSVLDQLKLVITQRRQESLILSPLGFESPAIHKVTVHPTGKHSLQPAITFDCISLCNLETLFTQPKTLQSIGRAGSIESMSSDSFFSQRRCNLTCFLFFSPPPRRFLLGIQQRTSIDISGCQCPRVIVSRRLPTRYVKVLGEKTSAIIHHLISAGALKLRLFSNLKLLDSTRASLFFLS